MFLFKKYDKKFWLDFAELIDAFRVIPRAVLLIYGVLVWIVVKWFMILAIPTTTQAALVTTVVGMAAVVIGLYTNSGRSWGNKLSISVDDKKIDSLDK